MQSQAEEEVTLARISAQPGEQMKGAKVLGPR
jgi:hypothetical protein